MITPGALRLDCEVWSEEGVAVLHRTERHLCVVLVAVPVGTAHTAD